MMVPRLRNCSWESCWEAKLNQSHENDSFPAECAFTFWPGDALGCQFRTVGRRDARLYFTREIVGKSFAVAHSSFRIQNVSSERMELKFHHQNLYVKFLGYGSVANALGPDRKHRAIISEYPERRYAARWITSNALLRRPWMENARCLEVRLI